MTMDRRMSESLDRHISGTHGEDQLRYLCHCKELHPCQCDALNHDPNKEDDSHTRHEAAMDRRALEHERYLDDNGIGL
jgi:hypothetical protein